MSAKRIVIHAGDVSATGELNDTPTAQAVWDALPLEGGANTWGDEIYFGIPVSRELEPEAQIDVAIGDLGYWPPGRAFCIFFGPTPASSGGQPRAASPVNMIGRVAGDARQFGGVEDGARVRVERFERELPSRRS